MSNSGNTAVTWRQAGDGVLVISLRWPPANALGMPIIDGLNAVLDRADGIHVVVVTSEVPGFFAAGADIRHMATATAEAFAEYGDALRGVLDRLAEAELISIAAVGGLALGGGLELALACTMRIAGRGARFGLPEVKLGLIPGAGGTQRLPRLVGRGRALDIMLTGRQVAAPEAYSIGLVDRVAESGTTEAALELAHELRALSLPAQRAAIQAVGAADDGPLAEGLGSEKALVQALFAHGEAKEGIAAFLEKRAPNFG